MTQIHIADGQNDNILDYITAKNIISDTHKKSLENTLETYNFITFADKSFSEFLEKRNRIIIPDEDDNLVEFVIFEAHKYRDREGHKAQVYAHASYLELKKASIIYPGTFTGTASQHGGRALNDTGWEIGIVESDRSISITFDNHTNPYEYLKRIANEFELELDFRVEHNGTKITRRIVDLVERIGTWRGREVTFGKDLDGIRRVEKQDIVTALLGIAPEDENGNRLEALVEDEEALQRWGRSDRFGNLQHLIEHYEIQSDRSEMTEAEARQYTRTALDKRINTQITYETTIVDLENVPGMDNKKIRFGDTIKIKDEKFNPPLYLEARVFELERSVKSKGKKEIKLGDFIEYTEEQVHDVFNQLRKEIRSRITRSEMVEHTYSKIEIDNKDQYVFTEGKTFAEAVGVEAEDNAKQFATDQDVALKIDVEGYADQAADQAEDNAKTYAEDVSAQALQQALAESVAKDTYNAKMAQIASDLGEKAGITYVDGKLQIVDGAIDDLNAEIDTKADGSTVYTISQVDNMINNTVSVTQYQTDINGIVTDLSSQGTQIGQNTEAIGLKADQTTVNALTGTVNSHSAQFLTMADEISARVTADYVQTAIDDIEIGGRNLLPNTGNFKTNAGWSNATVETKDGHSSLKVSGTMSENHRIRLKPNTEYIIAVDIFPSVDIPIMTSTPLHTYFRSTGNNSGNLASIRRVSADTTAKANQWTRIVLLAKTINVLQPGDNFKFHIYYPAYINAQSPAWVKDIQFMEGNKATDWSPAPEDIDAEISSLSAELLVQAGRINAKADSTAVTAIGTRVSTAETKISGLEGEITSKVSTTQFNTLSGTVSNLQSTVTQQAGLIEQKVDDGQVRSIFTQEAGSFTFQANQINFDGHVFGGNATFAGKIQGAEILSSTIKQQGTNKYIELNNDGFFLRDNVTNRVNMQIGTGGAVSTVIAFEPSENQFRFWVGLDGGHGHLGFTEYSTSTSTRHLNIKNENGIINFTANKFNFLTGELVVAGDINATSGRLYSRGIRNDTEVVYIGDGKGISSIGGGNAVVRIGTTDFNGTGQSSALMYFGRDGAGERLWSQSIYNRTYNSSANIHITDIGTIGRSTSARKYKTDIEPIQTEYAYNFFDNIHPVFYRPFNTADDNKEFSHYGYIADDVAPIEPRLVQFKDGEPESFNYDRVPALLHVVLKNEIQRIDALETENQLLKNELKIIKERIT